MEVGDLVAPRRPGRCPAFAVVGEAEDLGTGPRVEDGHVRPERRRPCHGEVLAVRRPGRVQVAGARDRGRLPGLDVVLVDPGDPLGAVPIAADIGQDEAVWSPGRILVTQRRNLAEAKVGDRLRLEVVGPDHHVTGRRIGQVGGHRDRAAVRGQHRLPDETHPLGLARRIHQPVEDPGRLAAGRGHMHDAGHLHPVPPGRAAHGPPSDGQPRPHEVDGQAVGPERGHGVLAALGELCCPATSLGPDVAVLGVQERAQNLDPGPRRGNHDDVRWRGRPDGTPRIAGATQTRSAVAARQEREVAVHQRDRRERDEHQADRRDQGGDRDPRHRRTAGATGLGGSRDRARRTGHAMPPWTGTAWPGPTGWAPEPPAT